MVICWNSLRIIFMILFDYFKVNVYYKVCLISRVLFFLKNCVMRILYLENKVFVS